MPQLEQLYANSRCVFPSEKSGTVGAPLLIFVAGYPDSCTSGWGSEALEELGKTHRIITLCLPGYDRPRKNIPKWGWDLPTLMEGLHVTIESLLEDEVVKDYSLVVHDWGSFIGMTYQNRHPERVQKMVVFDVGIFDKPEAAWHGVVLVFYQWWFAFSFLISQAISHNLGNMLLLIFYTFFSWTWLAPCPRDVVCRPTKEVDIKQCYMYYHFWLGPKGMLRNGFRPVVKPRFPTCPLLFM
jgi:pimeloyl-ACP methyl ester carboxylesterase